MQEDEVPMLKMLGRVAEVTPFAEDSGGRIASVSRLLLRMTSEDFVLDERA